MNPQVKEKWLAALRSGKYKQTTGALHNKNGYCCLGVLCDLAIQESVVPMWARWGQAFRIRVDDKHWESDYEAACLPPAVVEWAGLESPNPTVKGKSLAEANDSGIDFDRIADLIERGL